MNIESLDALLSRVAEAGAAPGEACTVTLENNTPPAWNAVIVYVACQFIYRDGTYDIDERPNSFITSGQGITLNADKKDCVKTLRLGAKVRVPNQPDVPVGNEDTAPDNKCFAHPVYSLIPQQFFAEKAGGRAESPFLMVKQPQ
jgi:hypothetical protein